MDLNRARSIMSAEGLDALLVVGPENVAYATRTGIGPAHMNMGDNV